MLFLYSLMLFTLGVAKVLIGWRVASLERGHARMIQTMDEILRQPAFKDNGNRSDPLQAAKRQFVLGQLVQKRDRLEHRYDSWLASYEKFARMVAALRSWKGKTLPYTFGVVDVLTLLMVADYLGAGQYFSGRYLVELLTSLISNG